jgi:hypothetical protein
MAQDFGTFIANESTLKPENLTGLLVELNNGQNVMESILPVKTSADSFIWHTESDSTVYNLPKEVGEKAEANKNAVQYAKHNDVVKDFRESMDFSEKELRMGNTYDIISAVERASVAITSKLKLAVEFDAATELSNTTKYNTINTQAVTAAWTSTSASDPIADITNANFKIRSVKFMDGDVVLMSASAYRYLMLSDKLRDSNMYTRDVVGNLVVERVNNVRVVIVDAVYAAEETGILTPVLENKLIVVKSGLAGEIRESQAIAGDRDYIKSTKTLAIYGERSFKTIVTDPKLICVVTGTGA